MQNILINSHQSQNQAHSSAGVMDHFGSSQQQRVQGNEVRKEPSVRHKRVDKENSAPIKANGPPAAPEKQL